MFQFDANLEAKHHVSVFQDWGAGKTKQRLSPGWRLPRTNAAIIFQLNLVIEKFDFPNCIAFSLLRKSSRFQFQTWFVDHCTNHRHTSWDKCQILEIASPSDGPQLTQKLVCKKGLKWCIAALLIQLKYFTFESWLDLSILWKIFCVSVKNKDYCSLEFLSIMCSKAASIEGCQSHPWEMYCTVYSCSTGVRKIIEIVLLPWIYSL